MKQNGEIKLERKLIKRFQAKNIVQMMGQNLRLKISLFVPSKASQKKDCYIDLIQVATHLYGSAKNVITMDAPGHIFLPGSLVITKQKAKLEDSDVGKEWFCCIPNESTRRTHAINVR